jgi:ATP-binding cassette, subfamily B (MDR/TAP), member 1
MIESGELNAGSFITVLLAVIFGSFALGSIGPRVGAFAGGIAASQEIFQMIARIPDIDSLDPTGDKPANIKGNIELKDVSFIYPSRPGGRIIFSHLLTL